MSLRNRAGLFALVILLIPLAVLRLRGAWPEQGERYVMVHSDDAGMCPAVNQATIDGLEHGSVSSCSIMVPCPGFGEFAEYASGHLEYDYGVHLTLTSELRDFRWGPVLPVEEVPSLVMPDGNFWHSAAEVGKHAKVEGAERELRAQIDRAMERGITISHLDNHMFSLFSRPDLMKLYVRLGRDYDLPIRMQKHPHPDDVDLSNDELVRTYYAALESLFSHNEPIFEMYEADNYDVQPDKKRTYFLNVLRSLQPGVSEILIHCGYEWDSPMRPHAANRRAVDTQVFTSLEIAQEIERLNLRLIDWKEFRALRKERKLGL